jgi:hypothetical protein
MTMSTKFEMIYADYAGFKEYSEDYVLSDKDRDFIETVQKVILARKEWFDQNYGIYTDETCIWYTDGGDDSHNFDTCNHNVIENWKKIQNLYKAYCEDPSPNKDPIFLENCETITFTFLENDLEEINMLETARYLYTSMSEDDV